MRITHLVVDDVNHAADDSSASVTTTVYEFGTERFVSAHRGVVGSRLGPMTLLETKGDGLHMPTVSMHSLGTRNLPTEGESVSFKDVWTIDGGSIYAVVAPEDFVATSVTLTPVEKGEPAPAVERGADDDGRLFYWVLFPGTSGTAFRVEARFTRDPHRAADQARAVDVVKGKRKYSHLIKAIPTNTRSLQLLLDLLQLGSKFFK